MESPDLIFVTGCNAAGKSSLIRTHLSLFPDFEVIMTDVYKSRSHDVFKEAVFNRKSIILETPFNNEGFKGLIDLSRNSGYQSTLIVLFLKSPAHSLERVAARRNFENGLYISAEEVEYNFIENFKIKRIRHFASSISRSISCRTFFHSHPATEVNKRPSTFWSNRYTRRIEKQAVGAAYDPVYPKLRRSKW